MSEHVHVIPVDPSLTPQQAWDEICRMGKRVTFTGPETWVRVQCDGNECSSVQWRGERAENDLQAPLRVPPGLVFPVPQTAVPGSPEATESGMRGFALQGALTGAKWGTIFLGAILLGVGGPARSGGLTIMGIGTLTWILHELWKWDREEDHG